MLDKQNKKNLAKILTTDWTNWRNSWKLERNDDEL